MFKSLKVGWIATDIGERIEASTAYIVDSLIMMGVHVKTHDTIEIFPQIYSMVTHNRYGALLREKGNEFVNSLDKRLKYDEKKWLMKIVKIPMDVTTVKSFDVIFDKELDELRDKWNEGYIAARRSDPNSNAGLYTQECIERYLQNLGHNLPQEFYDLANHFMRLDEVTKER